MSTSLKQIITEAGYDLETVADAEWLVSQEHQWDELLEAANELLDQQDETDYQDYLDGEQRAFMAERNAELRNQRSGGWL